MELSVSYVGRPMIRQMFGFRKEPKMLALYGLTGYFQGRGGVDGVKSLVASIG